MPTPTIAQAPPATPVDRDRVLATLVAAFSTDPVIRWFYPDPHRYLMSFPDGLQLFGEQAFAAGSADHTAAYSGAAIWLPPGAHVDEDRVADLLARTIDDDRHDDIFAFFGQMEEHHPGDGCWYLPFIGVDPLSQGRGHGSALLARGLARSDRDHVPAYLEASSPRNRALYERHGFVTIAEIQAGDSPPLWPMLRTAS